MVRELKRYRKRKVGEENGFRLETRIKASKMKTLKIMKRKVKRVIFFP
jgi:hypothetical protein